MRLRHEYRPSPAPLPERYGVAEIHQAHSLERRSHRRAFGNGRFSGQAASSRTAGSGARRHAPNPRRGPRRMRVTMALRSGGRVILRYESGAVSAGQVHLP